MKRTAVVGAGAVGTALARRLAACGATVRAVIGRRAEAARQLAAQVRAPVASADLRDLPQDVRLLFCCVPDDALEEVARALASSRSDWSGSLVAHTSGARPAAVLVPLARRGAATLSFHPMQTFVAGTPPEAFEGIYIGLEGDAQAVAIGRQVAGALGAHALVLSAEAKTRYHLAASLASNAFVTLMALAEEVLVSAGIEQRTGAALLRPLVESTWQNLSGRPPEEALTGPVARGDQETVAAHLSALGDHLPHLVPVYAALATEAVRVAVGSGKLAPEAAEMLLSTLRTALKLRGDPPF